MYVVGVNQVHMHEQQNWANNNYFSNPNSPSPFLFLINCLQSVYIINNYGKSFEKLHI